MGTNYYAYKRCGHCGHIEELHIGKSSGGWVFTLHVYPEMGINDLEDWKPIFDDYTIKNEYGDYITPKEMMAIITVREGNVDFKKKPWGYSSWSELHQKNHSEFGLNNLLRSKLSDRCIKHGEGTWDCHIGEFF